MQSNGYALFTICAVAVTLISCGQSQSDSGSNSTSSSLGFGSTSYNATSVDSSGNARCSQDPGNLPNTLGINLEIPVVSGVEQSNAVRLKFRVFPSKFFSVSGSTIRFYSQASTAYPNGTYSQLSFVVQMPTSSGYQTISNSMTSIADADLSTLASNNGFTYSSFYQDVAFLIQVSNSSGATLLDSQIFYSGTSVNEITALVPKFIANQNLFKSSYANVASFHPLSAYSSTDAATIASEISNFCF